MGGDQLHPTGTPRLGCLGWVVLGLLAIWVLSTPLALLAISGYQQFISPHKGWHCAYAAMHGGASCSAYGKEAIARHGVIAGASLLWERFDQCHAAAVALAASSSGKACDCCGPACREVERAADEAARKAKEDAKKAVDDAVEAAKDKAKKELDKIGKETRIPLIELKAPWSGTATITQGNNAPQDPSKFSHFQQTGWENIYALDFGKFPVGGEVLAPADGKVSEVIHWDGATSGGNVLCLEHNAGGKKIVTVYAHLSKFLVEQGQEVKQGQPIALSGDTGVYKGKRVPPHLHFHIWGGVGGKVSSTTPIDALILKGPHDADFRPYYSSTGDLNHKEIVGDKDPKERTFESNNKRMAPSR